MTILTGTETQLLSFIKERALTKSSLSGKLVYGYCVNEGGVM